MNGMNTENYKEIRYDDDRAKEWIYRAMTELTALEQKVLALFYSKEFTISDIADRVNLSPAGVRNTLAGARNTIRIRLRRFENESGLSLPETIPASALSCVIGERMEPLLLQIEHDEELRKQAEIIRQEELKRQEEQRLNARTKFYPGLSASGADGRGAGAPDGAEGTEQAAGSGADQPRVVIYGSPYERDRRRAALGALAAGVDLPDEPVEIPPIPPEWEMARTARPEGSGLAGPGAAAFGAATGRQVASGQTASRGAGASGQASPGQAEPGTEESDERRGIPKIIWLILALILVLVIGILGIKLLSDGSGEGADDGSGVTPAEEPADEQDAMSEAEKLAEAQKAAAKAYLAVIDDNEGAMINATQFDGSYDNKVARPAALADINGDGIDELFLLTMSTAGVEGSELHIYGFADGEARELTYEFCGEEGFDHYEVAGGGNFAVYLGQEPGTLYIYHCMVDDGTDYALVKYSYDGGQTLKTETTLTNWYWNHGDPNTTVDEYKENGVDISVSEGGDKFSAGFADFSKGLLFSTARGTDEVSLWDRFDTQAAAAMSLEEIRSALESAE